MGLKFVSKALDLLRFFAHYLSGTMSWGLKPCFSASESGGMTPFFIPYLSVRIRTLGRLNIHGGGDGGGGRRRIGLWVLKFWGGPVGCRCCVHVTVIMERHPILMCIYLRPVLSQNYFGTTILRYGYSAAPKYEFVPKGKV